MLATIPSATIVGVSGHHVNVEVHVSNGLPGFTIVGQPDSTCRESRDRVRAALLSSGLTWPTQRVTINLAPSGLRKIGAGLDLAIAVGLLVASGQLPVGAGQDAGFLAELGLDGRLRGVPGALPMAAAIHSPQLVVAPANLAEAELLDRHRVLSAETLVEVLAALRGEGPWPDPLRGRPPPSEPSPSVDLCEVKGHAVARTALEVAAAGSHHLLMVGPPGSGKTMLAERLPTLLGPLTPEEALEVTIVHSAAGKGLGSGRLLTNPPFRAPHHTTSMVAMVGGGTHMLRPGEVSLATNGCLFLDELGEFPPGVLDALRQPLEEGVVRVSRAAAQATLPARFLLVGAMNPCPCGFAGNGRCCCSEAGIARYSRRVSGPLLDRFDLRILVSPPDHRELLDGSPGESSASVAERVRAARERASARGVVANSHLTASQLEACTALDGGARTILERAIDDGRLSGRGIRRVRNVALTLDDLRGGSGMLDAEVVSLAMALRASVGPASPMVGAA